MVINPISNGIVLDHIQPGNGMKLYRLMHLDDLECSVAIIKNADSDKMGKKDIIKIDDVIDLDFDVIGYIDHGVTVNIIKNGKLIKRTHIELPKRVTNVIKCKNPRCITSIEQELPHVFELTNKQKKVYRCIYCETVAEKSKYK